MTEAATRQSTTPPPTPWRSGTTEPAVVRWLLIGACVVFLGCFSLLPAGGDFRAGVLGGMEVYLALLADTDALAAIRLTLLTAAVAVPLNVVFGVAAAWCIAKFEFGGKSLLITLIDLPFAVSPVIAGLILRAGLRRRKDGWAAGWRRTTSASCSPCRESCWRRSS